jgi:hypothetical protein
MGPEPWTKETMKVRLVRLEIGLVADPKRQNLESRRDVHCCLDPTS